MTSSNIPLYSQIARELRENIRNGDWVEGQRIPTEMELCDIYHVSRITIRKAIEEITQENLLVREKAKGTFVNHYSPEKTNHLTFIKSFTQEMKEQGKIASTINANVTKMIADHNIATQLKISVGDDVLCLKRTRGSDGEFLAYFVTYIPYQFPFSLDSKDYYGSFYDYLATFNIFPTKQSEYVEAIIANTHLQHVLKLKKSEPILKRVRFTTDSQLNFNEYTECFYIGSKYKYYLDFRED
ncbi:GntR family transcriptional regulator [Vagococcus fluvialis]|uniref:GntR family transcriptional regulator n=1 Tax=Vagococcus fluvialis TaxID=2738 RepID=UPI003B5B9E46